jgi:sphinganine-1-phosphate aldolase
MSWNGGFYATPNMAGSRPGNVVAGTWAAMMKIGKSGYLENAKLILSACSNLKKAIMAEVPEVVVATRQDTCVVTVVQKSSPNSINPIALCDVMLKHHHYKFGTI